MDTLSISSPASSFGLFELEHGEYSDTESIEVLGAEDSSNLGGDSPFITLEGTSALANIPTPSSTFVEHESTPSEEDRPVTLDALKMPEPEVKDDLVCAAKETNESAHVKAMEEGMQLNSIEFLFALLPAWKNVNGRRALYGQITAADAARVVEHASKVTKFIYPGRSSKDGVNSIPVDAYIRFLQHIPSPIFPSLESVRLLFVSVELHYLPLLLTPSLTHLEIGYISSDAAYAIGSFVASLPFEAPGLEHLELRGPCQLPIEAIDPLFQLTRLRRIELDDIIPIETTSQILRQLATLPLLEDLSIVMRPTAAAGAAPAEPVGSFDNGTGFSKLQRLQIIGPLRLLYEAIGLISSRELRVLQLSAISLPSESSPDSIRREEQARLLAEQARRAQIRQQQREEEERQRQLAKERELAIQNSKRKADNAKVKLTEAKDKLILAEASVRQAMQARRNKRINKKVRKLQESGVTGLGLQVARQNLERDTTLESCGNGKKVKGLKKEVDRLKVEATSLSSELSLAERAHGLLVSAHESQPAPSAVSVAEDNVSKSTTTLAPTKFDEWQLTLNRIVDLTSNLWHESLENFALSVDNPSSAPVIDLSGLLGVVGQGWPNIRQLRLPISHTTGATFDMLHSIAKHSPLLEYLKLQMDVTTLSELPDKPGATIGLLHGLKTLSVNSDTSVDDRQGRLRLARYINLLFPHLEALLPREDSQTAAMWKDIHDHIKFFQLIREDDRARGLLG